MKNANLGMQFEELINRANMTYALEKKAIIQKVPTDWRVVRSFNPMTKKREIVSAYPAKKSTVDYIGIANGRPIAFDAKSTENKTRFALQNIEAHQLKFLDEWSAQGGKAFFLVEFVFHKQVFLMTLEKFVQWASKNDRSSIPYHFFNDECIEVKQEGTNVLHYLKGILPSDEV